MYPEVVGRNNILCNRRTLISEKLNDFKPSLVDDFVGRLKKVCGINVLQSTNLKKLNGLNPLLRDVPEVGDVCHSFILFYGWNKVILQNQTASAQL